ncbi:MAG: ECF-type sigma factor [Candidatus Eisenbacteria bacterium]
MLVDHSRARRRVKRGGGAVPLSLDAAVEVGNTPDTQILALDRALERFAAQQPVAARVVELRYFGGLTTKDAAEVLGTSARSVERHWQFARAWLYRELGSEGTGAE